jgi:hypothetical protein
MPTSSSPPSLRVAPPAPFLQYIALAFFGFVFGVIFYTVWMVFRTTSLWWVPPLLGIGAVGIGVVTLMRVWRDTAYELDARGISLLDANNRPTQLVEWSDIVEVRSGKQDEIFLYTQGRERFVRITPSHQNYGNAAPILLEHLYPLWREMTQQGYDKTVGAYSVFLIALLFIIVGASAFTQGIFPALFFISIGLFFAYQQSKSVRRIHFTSDGMVLTKVYGQELISAATITTVEMHYQQGRFSNYHVLLKLRDNRTIPLDGFALDPISLYCIVAAWQRDQLSNTAT